MGIQAAESHDVLAAIVSARQVTLSQVLTLRRQVWPDGEVSRPEAERLIEVHRSLTEICAEWSDFLVETLSDHLIDQAHPAGFISDSDARWLEAHIVAEGRVQGPLELELLITVLGRAVHAPHRLEVLALEAVADAILAGDRDLLDDPALEKGVIGDPQVALLRRILFAKGASRGDAISLDEAQVIAQLNRQTAAETTCAAWTTLYVTVLSNFLLTQRDYLGPARDKLRAIDSWLMRASAGPKGFADAVAASGVRSTGTSGPLADIRASFGALSPMQELYIPVSGSAPASFSAAPPLDEVSWLIDDLCRETPLTANERALLTFLNAGEYDVHPGLRSLVALAM